MISGIDHLVILVPNLEQAITQYTDLGFQVVRGGEHPGGTHNALVGFADGSYLELIAFQQPEQPNPHRWYRFLSAGCGLIDFALRCDDVDQAAARLREAGLDYTVAPGARRTPRGVELQWRSAQPPQERAGELPFLIQDVTPRAERVPGGAQARQPNGVVGVRGLVVAVRDLIEAAAAFTAILDEPTGPTVEEDERERVVRFAAGEQVLTLAEPLVETGALAERIQRKGDGPFEGRLAARGIEQARLIPMNQADGARLRLIPTGA